ncbi:microfibrillar-associated protein 2-like, partial [Carcharodon carcharias]|uniref:microfibrillar-associated protein 2-like n=1 Tax=Carcharodon carcharias TaxID=13397 RepID=UPI001B7E708A
VPQPTDFFNFPAECREERYPCTRLYSVYHPLKQCVHSLCFYSLRRMYVVNKEICMRTVCQEEEKIKADLCRTQFGWPRRYRRNNGVRQRIRCKDLVP